MRHIVYASSKLSSRRTKSAFFYALDSEPNVYSLNDVEFVEKFDRIVNLQDIKENPALTGMLVTKRGMRLSVQPVEKEHFDTILEMTRNK